MVSSEIENAARLLGQGKLVAFPTETVYGLGADAGNEDALRKIFQAKGRPFDHPLIVHISSPDRLSDWAREIPPEAFKLAQAFWPGPLTMILKKQPSVSAIVTGGQDTIGLRIPRHPLAQALLKAFGKGVAAPSANRFTHISPTTAAAVREELGDRVDLILDGGDCEVGLESTIIDMSRGQPVILRPGMLSAAQIEKVLGMPVLSARQDIPVTRAPGMHHLHYAPHTRTQILAKEQISVFLRGISAADLPLALVMHSAPPASVPAGVSLTSMPAEPSAYAHALYHTLRTLDHQQFKRIVIEQVSEAPEWEAIRDRLSKASH